MRVLGAIRDVPWTLAIVAVGLTDVGYRRFVRRKLREALGIEGL